MKTCVVCGNEFEASKYQPKQVCCSKPCTIKHNNQKAVIEGRKKQYSRKWKEKHTEEKKKMDLDYANRIYFGGLKYNVLKRDEYKCRHCECEDIHRLVIHHKDENKKNNVMDNLITLCRACHAKEHHSGELNSRYKEISRMDIEQAIATTDNLEEAAEKLGITRSTLRKKRQKFGMPYLDKHGRTKG